MATPAGQAFRMGRTLVTMYVAALRKGDAHTGQVLAGAQIRRLEVAAWPHSISAPLARQLTAEAAAFARRTAKLLLSQRDGPGPLARAP